MLIFLFIFLVFTKIHLESNEESLDNTPSDFIGDDSSEIASSGDHGRSGLSLGLMGHSGLPLLDRSSGFIGSLGSPITFPPSLARTPSFGTRESLSQNLLSISPSLCFFHHFSFCFRWEKGEDKRKEEE